MTRLEAYIFFDGNCADAMRWYERTLGGKLEVMTYGDSPAASQNPGSGKRVIHARLELADGGVLLASDYPAGMPYEKMSGFSLALVYPGAAEARRAFDALADGGKVTMKFEKTFFSEGFGALVDRYGTPWMVGGGMQG